MTRTLLVLSIVLVAGCFTSHEGQQAVGQDDCSICHMTQYNQAGTPEFPEHVATAPLHVGSQNCTLACADCHRTTTWSNSLGGCDHPETMTAAGSTGFPLKTLGTKHTNIKCIACHSDEVTAATGATSKLGANTDCTSSGCHPDGSELRQSHNGVTYQAGALVNQPYKFKPDDHRFCLDCHPQGLAHKHKFSRSGDHNVACSECHDRIAGPDSLANVTCVKCHKHDAAWVATRHDNEDGYDGYRDSPPAGFDADNFCLIKGCHDRGQSGD